MTYFNLHDQLEFYVAGALTDRELELFVAHLDWCETCTSRLPELMETAATLIPDSPAPHHLWASISRTINYS